MHFNKNGEWKHTAELRLLFIFRKRVSKWGNYKIILWANHRSYIYPISLLVSGWKKSHPKLREVKRPKSWVKSSLSTVINMAQLVISVLKVTTTTKKTPEMLRSSLVMDFFEFFFVSVVTSTAGTKSWKASIWTSRSTEKVQEKKLKTRKK